MQIKILLIAITLGILEIGAVIAQPSMPDNFASYDKFAPLTAAELKNAISVIKKAQFFQKDLIFSYVTLEEPRKTENSSPQTLTQNPVTRRAMAVLYDTKQNKLYEAVVDVQKNSIISWEEIPHAQPMQNSVDTKTIISILEKNPQWIEALTKRGIKNFNQVVLASGFADPSIHPQIKNHRLFNVMAYWVNSNPHPYKHPIAGLSAVVDETAQTATVLDTGVIPMSAGKNFLQETSTLGLRKAPNPLIILQKGGPSFQLHGNVVTWQNWRFSVSFEPRDGLVFHQISYYDKGRWRSILYRLSLSEIFVPYGDPDPQWSWQQELDTAEGGWAQNATPLTKGLDVPNNALVFDSILVNTDGSLRGLPQVVALYEKDGGIAWRHYQGDGREASRKAQDLVVSSAATFNGYDYILQYIFKQDASMEVVVSLTGVMATKDVKNSDHDPYGHLVAKNIVAPHHQHFFNFRLDFDVDGTRNWVKEENTYAMPIGPDNPQGNAFSHQSTLFKNTLEAERNVDMNSDRYWVIFNPKVTNSLGEATGYALLPDNYTPAFNTRTDVGFIQHQFWVTTYNPLQMNAMGRYPILNANIDGLMQWSSRKLSLINQDIVVWYTLGITHIPRTEDWPVMPRTDIAFKIVPVSFFDQNPALDLP